MKKLLLLLSLIILSNFSFSQEVSYSEAKRIAVDFFETTETDSIMLKSVNLPVIDTFITFYIKETDALKSAGIEQTPAFYIMNRSDKPGYVIISGDERVRKIIAFSTSENITSINPGLQTLLNQYVAEIGFIKESNISVTPINYDYSQDEYVTGTWLLGNIKWGQSPAPYNSLCPVGVDNNGNDKVCPAGCTATAMAQIMRYFKYPRKGIGSHSYSSDYKTESADFANTEYQYELMPEQFPDTDDSEISELLYHCGVSVNMDYSPSGSGAPIWDEIYPDADGAYPKYFGFKSVDFKRKLYFSWDGWYNLIKNEIDNKRPIHYAATDPDKWFVEDLEGSHAFIIDGYRADNTYHINWGWRGSQNNFFPLTLLDPIGWNEATQANENYDFKNNHRMLIGIEPANPDLTPPTLVYKDYDQKTNDGNYIKISSNIKLTFSEPIDLNSMLVGNITVVGSKHGPYNLANSEYESDDNTNTVIVNPATDFHYDEQITVTINSTITDLVGNGFDGDKNGTVGPAYSFGFTTESGSNSLANGVVTPISGTTSDTYTFDVTYTDQSGQIPNSIKVVVGSTSYNLSGPSGSISTGAVYSTSKTFNAGDYNYYFEAQTASGSTIRFPESGTKSFTVNEYAAGHDIALMVANVPSIVTPGRSFDVDINVRNIGDYTESAFTVDYYLYDPDGNECDHQVANISSMTPFLSITPDISLQTTSKTGFYSLVVIANNSLDEDRTNNTVNPSIYVGSDIDSEEYEIDALYNITVGQTLTIDGQSLYLWGANSSEAYFKINGGSLESYDVNKLIGVIGDTYAIQDEGVFGEDVYFYFGPASNKISVTPNPIVGYQGEEVMITVTSPSGTSLSSGLDYTIGEGYNDGEEIESWMNYEDKISENQRTFSVSLPTSAIGDYEGWIEFSTVGDPDYYKVLKITVLEETKDVSVGLNSPVNNSEYNEGENIEFSGVISNNGTHSEYVTYQWLLQNSNADIIDQITESSTITSGSSATSGGTFSTEGMSEGEYTITLNLVNFNDDNISNNQSLVNLSIVNPSTIMSNFLASVKSGKSPLEVGFSDLSSAQNTTITNWSWDFGDGQTSTQKNPIHTYSSAGIYAVSLTVSDGIISDSETKSQYIVVVEMDAGFSVDVTNGTSPLTVVFSDLSSSSETINSWFWQFGDGTTSTDQNPIHTYSEDGTYSVSLTIASNSADDIETKSSLIHVETPINITADFDADFVEGPSPLTINFTDLSTSVEPILSWHWDFGDGGSSMSQNPVHTYDSVGVYDVQLKVSTTSLSDSILKLAYITVEDSLTPSMADLSVYSFSGPTEAEPGSVVGNLINLDILNAGSTVSSTFSVGFYLSTDSLITTEDVLLVGGREGSSGIAEGEVQNISLFDGASIPTFIAPGNYFLGVLLDESNAITESDETNNYYSIPIRINITPVPFEHLGWLFEDANLEGYRHYSGISSEAGTDSLVLQATSTGIVVDGNSVLSGDVNGDSLLEIVTVQKNVLYVLSGSGEVLSSNYVGISGIPYVYVTMLADADGDNQLDIGLGYHRGNSNYGNLYTRIYNGSCNLLKELVKNVSADGFMYPRAIIEGDVITTQSTGYGKDPRGFSRWDYETATETWYYDVGPAVGQTSIADADNDGDYEITGTTWNPHNGATGTSGTPTTDSDMWCIVVDEDGNEVFSQKYPSPSEGSNYHKFVDFNGDNTYQILAEEQHSSSYPGTSQLHIFSASNGSTLHSFDGFGTSNVGWRTSICDMNDDGVNEIVTSNYLSTTSFMQYILDSQLNVLNSAAINGYVEATGDLTGDGSNEIVLRYQDTIKVLDKNLSLLDFFVCGADVQKAIISNTNSNGINEIIALADKVYILELSGDIPIDNCPQHFQTVWEGSLGTDHMNVYVLEAKIEGVDLVAGDEVGVFDGELCVGYGKVTHIINKQAQLSIIVSRNDGSGNGYTPGNEIYYRIWSCEKQQEFVVNYVNCMNNEGLPVSCSTFQPGETTYVSLGVLTHINYLTGFQPGWNLFSSPINPDSADFAYNFRGSIDYNSLVKIQDESGFSFEDHGIYGGWQNDIGDIKPTEGYKVKVTSYDSLFIEGIIVNYPFPISLNGGWNIMGYPQLQTVDALMVVNQLINSGCLVKVQDERGNSIENIGIYGGWQNFIGNFIPGEGYKIKVNREDTLWIYESYPKSTAIQTKSTTTTHFEPAYTGNGVDHMNINLVELSEKLFSVGDELAVYDGITCAGAAVLSEENLMNRVISIPASAKDDSGMPGFTERNTYSLRMWDSEQNREIEIEGELISGPEQFAKNESAIISLEKSSITGIDDFGRDGVVEVNCYPNPFSDEITIELSLKTDAEAELIVMNQLGQTVKYLISGQKLTPGIHRLKWNGENQNNKKISSGIYFLKINVGGEIKNKKLIYNP